MILADARAFTAAARKQWREARRYPVLWLSFFFWPILLPGVYVVMGTAMSGGDPRATDAFASRAGTRDVAGFVFVGWSMYMWLSNVLWGPSQTIRSDQLRGSLEAIFLTPTSRFVALVGPSTYALVPAWINFVVMAVALRVIFGVELTPDALARAALVMLAGIPAMYGIGALVATVVLRVGEIGGVVQLVRGVFTLACGVAFPIVMLPDWARAVAHALPPTYVVADARAVLLAGADLAAIVPDLSVLAVLSAATCAVAVSVFALVERDARLTGMLGRY
jgi:ABC-2 type transport system permease protein